MRRFAIVIWLGALLFALAACGGGAGEEVVAEATAVAPEVAAATETAPSPTETTLPPTATAAPTETPVPPTETPAPTATVETVASACVDCHSDKETLINTAEPVDDAPEEGESSGVG